MGALGAALENAVCGLSFHCHAKHDEKNDRPHGIPTFPCEYDAVSARLKLDDRRWHTQGNGRHGAELRWKLFREGSPDHGAISGGAHSARRELSQLSVPDLRHR